GAGPAMAAHRRTRRQHRQRPGPRLRGPAEHLRAGPAGRLERVPPLRRGPARGGAPGLRPVVVSGGPPGRRRRPPGHLAGHPSPPLAVRPAAAPPGARGPPATPGERSLTETPAMQVEARVLDLLMEYEERRDRGETFTPELLCAGCPDLLDEVRECLQ